MNLAVNARDAMPGIGKLTIETRNVALSNEFARQYGITASERCVMLAVTDTGKGIDEETRKHIFEPFFTTKELGKGTGLGLSTVYGIISQSGGSIIVDSEIDRGTTFGIYLPRIDEPAPTEMPDQGPADDPRGTETLLLVEDEENVRKLSRETLESYGYNVVEAQNGLEALYVCEKLDGKIDLLLTDVVMPQMGGRELAEKLTNKYPQMHVLFASGYTDDSVVRHGIIDESTNFIQKPFTLEALAQKVRKTLDEETRS
jgi:CheY-like chemotaxis protein